MSERIATTGGNAAGNPHTALDDARQRMADFQQRMAARSAEAAARRAAIVEPLRQQLAQLVDPVLFASRDAAVAEVRQARADLEAARVAVRRHEQTPPASRADTATWARQLGALRDEVSACELLHGQAEAAHQVAEQALASGVRAAVASEHQRRLNAWQEQKRASAAEVRRIEQEAQAAIKAEGQKIAEMRAPLDGWRQLAAELGVMLPELPGEEHWRPVIGG